MKATVPILLLALAAATAQTQCTTDTDCPDDLKCVVQADGFYAQCIDCAEAPFADQCTYWSDAILIAAEEACDQPCPTRCPGHSDDECANGLACVVQADNYYEQCTNCTAESFERECAGWSKEIRAAAEAKCGLNCTAAAGDDDDGAAAACATDADCPDDLKCVVQADGYYAQCVDCEEPTFDTQCAYWSEPILLAAEDACLLSCPTRCPTHSDDECDGALECVVQADGNWDLCVDCTQDAFYKACGAWSDAIKTAAEEKCGLACPYEGAGRAAARAVVA